MIKFSSPSTSSGGKAFRMSTSSRTTFSYFFLFSDFMYGKNLEPPSVLLRISGVFIYGYHFSAEGSSKSVLTSERNCLNVKVSVR
jgi:hypothetical protein